MSQDIVVINEQPRPREEPPIPLPAPREAVSGNPEILSMTIIGLREEISELRKEIDKRDKQVAYYEEKLRKCGNMSRRMAELERKEEKVCRQIATAASYSRKKKKKNQKAPISMVDKIM